MLRVEALHAAYGNSLALHGVDLSIGVGEVTCLIGRNGAGKTSTLRSIVQDIIQVTSGRIEFEGANLVGLPSHEIIKRGIGYVPEDRRVFASLTVIENLKVPLQPKRAGADAWSIDRVFELFPQLHEYRSRTAGVMSGGEQQMLSIARSLLTCPKLLLLDEPHEGLAPKVAEDVVAAIVELKRQGVSMIVSEQAMHTIKECADKVSVIDRGTTAWEGTTAEFYSQPEITERYLMVT